MESYDIKFKIGAPVEYQNKAGKDYGIVTGVNIRSTGITYGVTWSDKEEKWHYDFELKYVSE